MARPPGPPSTQVAVRIEDELLEQIDTLIPLLRTPGSKLTRSDVIRRCIIEHLPVLGASVGLASGSKAKPRKPR